MRIKCYLIIINNSKISKLHSCLHYIMFKLIQINVLLHYCIFSNRNVEFPYIHPSEQ